MKPFKLQPFYKETIWGGSRLKTLFGKDIPSDKTGETWEVSVREEGASVALVDGEKIPFNVLFDERKEEIMGKGFEGEFPLLVKLIDANDKLSVQVHPSDENSKTEMWYIIHAEENASLVAGFTEEIEKDELKRRAIDGTLEEKMNFEPVKKGDSFFIPAGLVHAIGKGIVILEVQQNSDTTYRLYDYNRGREIHVEEGVRWSDTSKYVPHTFPEGCLSKCEYFDVRKADAKLPFALKGFAILFAESDKINVDNELTLEKGEFAVIPESAGETVISGEGEVIYVTL